MKENTQKGQKYWGAGEVDRVVKRNPPWVDKNNNKNIAGMAEEKKSAVEGNHG